MSDVPQLPKIVIEGIITNEAGRRLLQWKEFFEKIGIEEIKIGSSQDFLMEIIFDALGITTDTSPIIEASFLLQNKATLRIVTSFSEDCEKWDAFLEEIKHPLFKNDFESSWEGVLKKIISCIELQENIVPNIPKDLLDRNF